MMKRMAICIKDNASRRWSAGNDYSHTIFQYYLEVKGDNIESLTYTLNQGEFSNYPEHSLSETEYYGNECSLTYEEQKDRNYLYAISVKGYYKDYGYDIEEVRELGYKDIDASNRIYYEVLDKAISDTTMTLDLIMKDGRTIIKKLTFNNVLDSDKRKIYLSVSHVIVMCE